MASTSLYNEVQNPAYRTTVFYYEKMKLHSINHIWNVDESRFSSWKRWNLRMLKRTIIIVESFNKNNLSSYASALTYSTLLAAVPVLAIVFAIARGFGFGTMIEERIRESLQANPEITDTIMNFVDSYLQHTQGGVFIGVGLIILLYTVVSLTTNIEKAFNTIWQVRTPRNVYRRITDYISVFVLLPIAVVITMGIRLFLMTITNVFPAYQIVSNTVESILRISPPILICFAFSLLYTFMPNTEVKFRHTIFPAILAGIAFQLVEYIYMHYQLKLSSYNAIYGSFAAIPMFMLWANISWSICLIGAQMCYANQRMEDYAFERNSRDLSRRYKDSLSLLLMCRICKKFAQGGTAFTVKSLSSDTRLPQTLVSILLDELVNMQLLVETHNEKGTITKYLPAFDIHRMTISMVMKQIDSYGADHLSRSWQISTEEWEKLRHYRISNGNKLLIEV